jgi:hypothetical protein
MKKLNKSGSLIIVRLTDAELISYRYTSLKRYRQQHRTLDLIYLLKEGLTYDIANIGHPMLFAATRRQKIN